MNLPPDLEMDYIRYVNNLMTPDEVASFNQDLNTIVPSNPPVDLETDYILCINNLMTPAEKLEFIKKLTISVPPECSDAPAPSLAKPPKPSGSPASMGVTPEPSGGPAADVVRPLSDFDVFLCYNSSDEVTVTRLAKQLKGRGILPWLDKWELRPGLPWQKALEQQIGKIKSATVFVGKEGIGPWQQQELDAFLREFVARGCPVIPVLLEDAPKEPALPIFLRGMMWVDFHKQEPNPIDQLIWGITGKRQFEA